MVEIKNKFLCAKINEKGAELKSLKMGDKEYIWQGDEKFWASSAPLVFPICSGLKDDEYYLNGVKYKLEKHGFIRFKTFEVEKRDENSVTFIYTPDDDSKKSFPFDYELRLTYVLDDKTLRVLYNIKNKSDSEMYFSIGAHEGYACEEGIEEYDVILPEAESLVSSVLEGNLIGDKKVQITENSDTLSLKYDYFAVDALVFENMKARSVILKKRNGKKALKVTFDGFDYFLIWTKPDAPYVCLEPWCGISDKVGTNQDIKTKEGIISLEKGGEFAREHSIEIIE